MAERAGLENRRPRKGSASSNLAPSAMFSAVKGRHNHHKQKKSFITSEASQPAIPVQLLTSVDITV